MKYRPPSGRSQTSLGPLSSLPSKSFTTTVTFFAGSIIHISFFSSAQAQRLPWASKHRPLDRPQGFMKVVSLPSVLHFMIRSLGWSVKNTLPWASAAGPSVNSNPPASTVSFAPGAMIGTLGGREPAAVAKEDRDGENSENFGHA